MKARYLIPTLFILFGCSDESMTAEVQSTSARVTTLEQRLESAERRLAILESARTTRPQTRSQPAATSAKWMDLSLWNQLRPGMTEARVKSILGEPTEVFLNPGSMGFAYGESHPCRGLVLFDTYTRTDTLRETSRPSDCN
jgi:hypothetical protein